MAENAVDAMMKYTDSMTPYAPSMKLDFDNRREMEIQGIYTNPIIAARECGCHMKKVEFRISVSPQLPSMLYGDEVRIKQIVTNLMTNAIKYTQKGSVTLVADCERVAMNRVRLKISVSDTGIGIRQDDMQKLFDSFNNRADLFIMSEKSIALFL